MKSFDDLPEDVKLQILLQLQVKYLIRFSCVSKRWRHRIVSDVEFAKAHLKIASQHRTLTGGIVLTIYDPSFEKPITRPTNWFRCYTPVRFQILDYKVDEFSVRNILRPKSMENRILCSCNGLLLVGHPCGYYLSIWNVTTGFFRKIPSLSIDADTPLQHVYYGFGHVSAIDDYKLVFVIPLAAAKRAGCVQVHVFSLRANVWKKVMIETCCSSWPKYSNSGHGTLSNEAIHWVAADGYPPVIYAFDLADEEFRLVTLPPPLYESKNTEISTIVHVGGYLCVWTGKTSNLDQLSWSRPEGVVWAMSEYGVPESWMKLFKFRWGTDIELSGSYPCFVTKDSRFVVSKLGQELLWIECPNDIIGERPVCSRRYRVEEEENMVVPKAGMVRMQYARLSFHAIAYDETLISVRN